MEITGKSLQIEGICLWKVQVPLKMSSANIIRKNLNCTYYKARNNDLQYRKMNKSWINVGENSIKGVNIRCLRISFIRIPSLQMIYDDK